MVSHRVLWAELAERQYLDLPGSARDRADRLLAQLEDAPTQVPGATYDQAADHWTAPYAEFSFILYAVVPDRTTVIILRIVHVDT